MLFTLASVGDGEYKAAVLKVQVEQIHSCPLLFLDTQFLSMTHIISVTPTIYNFTFLQIPDWQVANTLGLFFLCGIFTSKSKGSQVSTKSRLKLINFPFPNNIA